MPQFLARQMRVWQCRGARAWRRAHARALEKSMLRC
jgi:hypothetical protein